MSAYPQPLASLGSQRNKGDPQARFEERYKKLEQARERRETINRKRFQEAA